MAPFSLHQTKHRSAIGDHVSPVGVSRCEILLLTPVLGQVTVASARMDPPMVRRKSWRVGSTKIEVLTDRRDGPAVDHCAIAEIGGTANRGLCQCERTDQAEGGRQTDCCEGHAAFPCFARRNEHWRDWLQVAIRRPLATRSAASDQPSATIGFVLQERLASRRSPSALWNADVLVAVESGCGGGAVHGRQAMNHGDGDRARARTVISGLEPHCRQLRQMRRSSTSPYAPKVERITRPQLPSPVQPPPARRLLNADHGLAGKQFLKMLFGTSNVAANCERKSGAAAAKLNHRNIQENKRYNNRICRPRQQKVQKCQGSASI